MTAQVTSSKVFESEGNNSVSSAQALGELAANGALTVYGSITSAGTDPADVFSLAVPERVQLEVELFYETVDTATDADLSLELFDPVANQTIESFDLAGAQTESGSFIAKGAVFLTVRSNTGGSAYTLSISATALADPIPEVELNDSLTSAMYLGELLAADSLSVSGSVSGGDRDFFLIGFPAALVVDVSATMQVGTDIDITVYDATTSIAGAIELGSFETSNNPETGAVDTVSPMVFLAFEVFEALDGTTDYTLSFTPSANPLPGGLSTGGGSVGLARTVLEETVSRGALSSSHHIGRPSTTAMMSGELLVGYHAGEDAAAHLAERGMDVLSITPGHFRRVSFPLPAGLSAEERARYTYSVAASLTARSEVRYASPNYLARPYLDTTPDDQLYPLQWHYPQIQLPAAWDLETGDSNVRIAVLDTGQLDHPDLVGRLAQGYDMISDVTMAGDGDGRDTDPTDEGDGQGNVPNSYHGTHVAGTIGADTDNTIGVAGVTWAGEIFHVRVLGIGGGSFADIYDGVLYAAGLPNSSGEVASPPADVINMSLGAQTPFDQAGQDAVTAAWNAGAVVVAAAGNENSGVASYPAAFADVISVAAVDYESNRSPYSNFHPTVDVAAPGGDTSVDANGDSYADGVLSTMRDDNTAQWVFSFSQGTSMASPHVAGVCALIKSVNPAFTADQVEGFLESTATDRGVAGQDDEYGAGLINAHAALVAAQAADQGGATNPILSLGAQSVSLPDDTDTLDVSVANIGGGTLSVSGTSTSTSSGGAWLSAATVAGSGSSDTSAIRISVDRAGLTSGSYEGTVTVSSNATNTPSNIGVTVLVGTGEVPAPNIDIFVLLVDSLTLSSVAQVVINPTTSLEFELEQTLDGKDIPPGLYWILAGSDIDDDGLINDAGEPFFGGYPTLNEVVAILLVDDEDNEDLDFTVVDPNATLSRASASNGLPEFRRTR